MFIGKELGVGNTPPGNSSNLLQEICDKYPEICKPLVNLINKRKAVYEFHACLKNDLNELKELQNAEENAVKELREVYDSIKKNLP
jgi:hypothetical protein